MRVKLFAAPLAFFTLVCLCTPSEAQFGGSGLFLGQVSATCSGYTPPLDTQSGAVAAFSFRKLRSAYAGFAVRLERASDSTILDVGFSGCDFNTTAATTFCAATTCSIATWYDQSGNVANATQATLSQQPTVTLNCQNGHPCAVFAAASSQFLSGTFASAVGADTFAIVGELTSQATSTFFNFIGTGSNTTNLAYSSSLATCRVSRSIGSGAFINCSNLTWYRFIGILNNTLSSIYLSGTKGTDDTTSGTIVASTALWIGSTQPGTSLLNGKIGEDIIFAPDLSSVNALAVSTNQGSYWGI